MNGWRGVESGAARFFGSAVLRVTRGHGQGGWVPACARTTGGGRAPTRDGHVGEEECGGRWEWHTVMGWRGVERGAVRFLAEPRNDWGRHRMVVARGRMGGRAPTGDGHVGEEGRVGWREWRTVMGWRGVERGPVRFLAEPRNDRGRYRMVRGNG